MRFLSLLRCSLLVLKFVESVFASVFKAYSDVMASVCLSVARHYYQVLTGEKYNGHVRMIVYRKSDWLEVSVIDFLSSR